MVDSAEQNVARRTPGLILHSAARYDLLVWLFTLGRERAFRERMLRLARLRPGEVVLDVGCGTGTLAILAGRQVGPTGAVYGIDASPEMIERTTRKARRQGARVMFKVGAAQALPFPNAQLDVVLTTLMLHHLPRPSRQQLAREIRRVLKPGGRVLAVDFGEGGQGRKRLLRHLHRPHGHTKLEDMVALLSEAGLTIVESGAVGMKNLQFVCATAPSGTMPASEGTEQNDLPEQPADFNQNDVQAGVGTNGRRHLFGVVIVLVAVIAVVLHVGVAASFFTGGVALPPMTSPGFFGLAGLVLLIVVVKTGLILGWHFKRRSGVGNSNEQGGHAAP